MPTDDVQVKRALDYFENDDFEEAGKILRQQIKAARNDVIDALLDDE